MDDSSAQTLAATQTIASQRRAPTGDEPPPGANPHTWNLLHECRALANLSSMALQDVLAVATERSFQPGDVLMAQGDPAEGLLILLEGAGHVMLRGADGEGR